MYAAEIGPHVGDAADSPTANLDLPIAQKAVIIHAPQEWPTGVFCANCHARYPCWLQRWGLDMLVMAGWSQADIRRLVERAKAGDVPWV